MRNTERLRDALLIAAERFEDLGRIIQEHGSYDNAGFMLASAGRCRNVLAGRKFEDAPPPSTRERVR